MLRSFKALKVWQKSYELCLKTYRITATFPKGERYGLTSQIRRSAVSIPSNLAYGSICELETQILLAADIGFIDTGNQGETIGRIKEVERMLKALIRTLEQKHLDP